VTPVRRGVSRRRISGLLPDAVRLAAVTALGRAADGLGAPPAGLRAGRGRDGAGSAPVVLVLHLGATSVEAVEDTVRALTERGAGSGAGDVASDEGGHGVMDGSGSGVEAGNGAVAPRPVLVLDTPHLAVARRAGFAVDHVLSPQAWRRYPSDLPHAGYLAERLDQLCRDYATRHLVTVPPGGPAALPPGTLAAALIPVRHGRVRRVRDAVVGRVEANINRLTSGR
jgi:hypothetical protein